MALRPPADPETYAVSETIVMLVTVIATLATSNLAVGVVLGVITAMISFARRVAHITHVERIEGPDPATNT